MELRNYQEECIEILKSNKKKQLIQLPTGSGKTVIFLSYLRKNSKKALIVVPTLDLQYQIYENALNFYHKDEICMKKNSVNLKKSKIYILVANSLASEKVMNFFLNEDLDHIIIDEAHKALSKMYMNFIDFYETNGKNFKLIGFTATPERLDRKSLLGIFKEITYKKTIYNLIQAGYLCDVKCYRIKTNNKIESENKTQDFKSIEIKSLDNYSRNKLIYDTLFEHCLGKKTLIFCLSVDHAEKIAHYLRSEKGIKAFAIHGNQKISHRKEILNKFKSGEIKVLTNCQLLTEGFDEPSIECLIIARPTKSKSLYCQMIGRGVRKFPNKEICNVYELTDNSHKICTFNVAADDTKETSFKREYPQGITLTRLHQEINEISLSDYILEKEEISILSTFEDFIKSHGLLDCQKKKLKEKSIMYIEPVNMLEAGFLLFLQGLKEKYGFN